MSCFLSAVTFDSSIRQREKNTNQDQFNHVIISPVLPAMRQRAPLQPLKALVKREVLPGERRPLKIPAQTKE
jgi:hypothetical protein